MQTTTISQAVSSLPIKTPPPEDHALSIPDVTPAQNRQLANLQFYPHLYHLSSDFIIITTLS